MLKKLFLAFLMTAFSLTAEAKLPDLTPKQVTEKADEIMSAHVSQKKFNQEVAKRTLSNFAEELDPTKTYLIEPDIKQWLEPSDALLDKVIKDFNNNNFSTFYDMFDVMVKAIARHRLLEKEIHEDSLPKHVDPAEFKDLKWATSEQDLLNRLIKIKALQIESSSKLSKDIQEKSMQRIEKRQTKFEDDILTTDAHKKQQIIMVDVLKSIATSLDTHTSYFTPEEAQQFMIGVQQRLFGIGAQLRDDINGFTIVKIIDGGPAANSKQLKLKDRIIAVNHEPVVGMDIVDAVDLIRGEKNTPVVLTVVRETGEGKDKKEETVDVTITRGEVVLKESRYDVTYEPFGDGVIAYLRLHSFYQDNDSSSAQDLTKEFEKIRKDHKILGVILDLRYNSGGMLSQAVAVTGLFISKGIVVSIRDENGNIQNLRNLETKPLWSGPLIVLANRASASASEIVTQALKDYGRAIIVGDDHTYGKGSFQTFTLNTENPNTIDPEGEFKVTRGLYYTVSGKTPQLEGVPSDIIVPGPLSESEIGEKFSKYPLPSDNIKANFEDDLTDVPVYQRDKVASLYKFNLQPKLTIYNPYLPMLKENSQQRLDNSKDYQNFLKELKKKDKDLEEEENPTFPYGQNDLQLQEAYSIMKDLIVLMMLNESSTPSTSPSTAPSPKAAPAPAAGPH
jgi:carboxyl-terminal processing protease